MEKKGWTQAELARRSRISEGSVSHVIRGTRSAGFDFCEGVAQAFGYPVATVYRAAGLLPPETEVNELIEQILHEAARLSLEDQEDLLHYAKMRRELSKTRK